MTNTEERKDFNKVYWRFLWSSILIALSGCLGNVVDAIIVGNLIDENGVIYDTTEYPVTITVFPAIDVSEPPVKEASEDTPYKLPCVDDPSIEIL